MPASPSDRARAAWRTLTSRAVYANPWIRVREDIAELPDGRTTLYGVVECAAAVGVLPFLDERTVVLVGQWRYVSRAFRWEIPTGAVKPGESEEAAVHANSLRRPATPPIVSSSSAASTLRSRSSTRRRTFTWQRA